MTGKTDVSPTRPRKSRSKSPKRNGRSRSFSPMNLLQGKPRTRHGLHMVPEASNESSSDSFQNSSSTWAKQEQMIQALTMTSLDEPELDAFFSASGHELKSNRTYYSSDDCIYGSIDDMPQLQASPLPVDEPKAPQRANNNNNMSSLENLHKLPDLYSNDGDTVTPQPARGRKAQYSPQSTISGTVESGSTKPSIASIPSLMSNSSMPSLSSIMEHDLASVGSSRHLPYSCDNSVDSTNSAFSGSLDSSCRRNTPRTSSILSEDGLPAHLEGKTLDCLGAPVIQSHTKSPQQRWASNTTEGSPNNSSKHGALSLPRTGGGGGGGVANDRTTAGPPPVAYNRQWGASNDFRPVAASRRDSDSSTSARSSRGMGGVLLDEQNDVPPIAAMRLFSSSSFAESTAFSSMDSIFAGNAATSTRADGVHRQHAPRPSSRLPV
eukprot:Nitzschia sp. Nitz4//scaffold26_size159584//84077//85384//NITZ4_002496-RA/size159584-processed-gene-0.233-mRNA-1//-1//CDS//3329545097//432//frame0